MKEKIFIVILFAIATALGTISHEFGHFLAASYYGLDPVLHYDFTEQNEDAAHMPLIIQHRALVTFCGILVTLVIGTAGFLLTVLRRKNFEQNMYLLIFPVLAFFYSREIFLLVISLTDGRFFSPTLNSGDEFKLALLLGLDARIILIVLNIVAAFVCVATVMFLPREKRLNFLIFGLAGTVIGYFTWFRLVGPLILP